MRSKSGKWVAAECSDVYKDGYRVTNNGAEVIGEGLTLEAALTLINSRNERNDRIQGYIGDGDHARRTRAKRHDRVSPSPGVDFSSRGTIAPPYQTRF